MTSSQVRNVTLREVARTDVQDAASADYSTHVRRFSHSHSTRLGLSTSCERSVDGQLRAAVDGFLDRDVVGILAAGWSTSRTLRAAAAATLGQPGAQRTVELATQKVDYVLTPAIDVIINGVPTATLALTVTAELTVHDLAAAVANGAVFALEFGRCDITATITSEQGTQLLRRTLTLTSNAQLRLPRPVRLPP